MCFSECLMFHVVCYSVYMCLTLLYDVLCCVVVCIDMCVLPLIGLSNHIANRRVAVVLGVYYVVICI